MIFPLKDLSSSQELRNASSLKLRTNAHSSKPVLVVGAGIAGIQAALDLAEQGIKVYLIDRNPSIGGKMALLDKTFPTLDCASCILAPKMASVQRNPNIKILTLSELKQIDGKAGNFHCRILKHPSYVDWEKCTGCGTCIEKCPQKVPDEFNLGMSKRKAIFIAFPQAVPRKAVIDAANCLRLNPPQKLKERAGGRAICGICERFCPAGAIKFSDASEEVIIEASAVIIATGMEIYDARNVPEYGYGKYQNVFVHLEFERMLSSTGPTGGLILRRSDGKPPRRIAWIQCVGSRDIRFNHYCSSFCCMAATKQAVLAKEHLENVSCTIYYMDIRAFGKGFNEFIERAKNEFGIKYVRGKVARIEEDPSSRDLTLIYEDTSHSYLKRESYDLVVLAVAIRPNRIYPIIPVETNEDGFVKLKDPYIDPVSTTVDGIFVAGVAAGAKDIPDSVSEASAAAARAALIAKQKGGAGS
ncbi:MAG: CoB--CoM heterodisulfide reductase iron-sulfur subunit A family protein [Fervidicoccaceae archaeon]